jgi:hypothetical protein
MRKRALSLLLSGLLCLATQLSASGDDQAACAAGSPAAQQADAAAPTCASLEARLAATGLHAMHGLQPDGPEHCRVVVRDQWARGEERVAGSWAGPRARAGAGGAPACGSMLARPLPPPPHAHATHPPRARPLLQSWVAQRPRPSTGT